MALNKQINLYNIDTNAFLTTREKYIKRKSTELLYYKNELEYEKRKNNNDINKYKKIIKDCEVDDFNYEYYNTINGFINNLEEDNEICDDFIVEIENELKWRKPLEKEQLLFEFLSHVYKNKYYKHNDIRILSDTYIKSNNVVGMFSSELSRSLNVEINSTTDDIFIVDIYYFDIAQDLILHGFNYKGEKYIYFSSSAGQIRTKKAVFVKESSYNKVKMKIMCGLTIDRINSLGGMNVNKFLAYLSLCNSATETWEEIFGKEFDIDRCIVVDDFETLVKCRVDNINYETYEITRDVDMEIPIPHTDGAGLILKKYTEKNFMVRLPWIKGLLGSFDFVEFIKENNASGKVKDIWGKEWDIIEDDIQVIFTKSQLKMWKYYKSWGHYKSCFKKYGCNACVCNMEEEEIPNSKINYQMLQSLYDMTDGEIKELCALSNNRITTLSDSLENMLKVFGVDKIGLTEEDLECDNPFDEDYTYLQRALQIYPELIRDKSTKDTIADLRNSMVKRYKAGKLDVVGKYTFVLPDLYAFCECLFLGIETPNGLLEYKEVYCGLFKKQKELDCLRAPHLYIEHAIRTNVACKDNSDEERLEKLAKWLGEKAIYTSTKDAISRILQFDVDGDHLLVIAQKKLIEIAKRHMNGINPLYYEMKKAKAERLTGFTMYKGLILAFVGGNIGVISNDITKIWNDDSGINQDALDSIKWLCMETNFTIDYAKTLFKPTRPEKNHALISRYHKKKVPYFFHYAKKKILDVCESPTNSVMNRIAKEIIDDKRLTFKAIKGLAKLDYRVLMNDKNILNNEELCLKYDEFNQKYRNKLKYDDGGRCTNEEAVVQEFRNFANELGYTDIEASDILVRYLYAKPTNKAKTIFWATYGDILNNNIIHNIDTTTQVCKKCGKRVQKDGLKDGLCDKCKTSTKTIVCVDCGIVFETSSQDTKSCRCINCQVEKNKERKRIWKQKQ